MAAALNADFGTSSHDQIGLLEGQAPIDGPEKGKTSCVLTVLLIQRIDRDLRENVVVLEHNADRLQGFDIECGCSEDVLQVAIRWLEQAIINRDRSKLM